LTPLLDTYQVLRTAIADAADTVPGRASFAVALNAARVQVVLAAVVTITLIEYFT
jgi:hypothetical protein